MRTPLVLGLTLTLTLLSGICAMAQEQDPAALAERLADPTQKEAAADALVALGEAALPALEQALGAHRSSDTLRREVLHILPSFGAPGVALLRKSLADPALELEAARNLAAQPWSKGEGKSFFSLMDKSLNPRVRLVALEWLAEKGPAKEVNDKLFSYLSDSSDKVRSRTAGLLAERVGVVGVPRLMEMLRQAEFAASPANRNLRLALLETFGHLGVLGPAEAARVVPTLMRALGIEDEKQVAVEALIRIGAPSVPSLLMILKAGDTRRAAAAMDALLAIGQKAAPEVVSLLQARHPKMRRMAQQFLGFYQDPAVFPLLRDLYPRVNAEDKVAILRIASLYKSQEPQDFIVQATLDEDDVVRTEAVKILASTAAPGAVPVLLTRAEEDADLDIRLAAVRGLYGMGEGSAVTSFARMLEYEKWQVRLELLHALAFLGTPTVVKPVAEQLRHRKSEVASRAQRALANMTFMTGQRSPEEWVREVDRIIGTGEDAAEVVRKTITGGDENLEVALVGNGKEQLLYLAPNVTLTKRFLVRYLSILADHFTVVVVPFKTCGQDGERPALSECLKQNARQLEWARQELGDKKVVVMGHGASGLAALVYAAQYPEAVSKVVFADPVFPRRYHVEKTLAATFERLPTRWQKEREYVERTAGELLPRARNLYTSHIELAGQVRGEGKAMLLANGYYGLSWLLNETYFSFEDTAVESALANVRVPILLVCGAEDYAREINRESFRRLGKIRGNLVSTTIAGAMRGVLVEQPETFQKAVLHFVGSYHVAQAMPESANKNYPAAAVVYGGSEASPLVPGVGEPAVAHVPDGLKEVQPSRLTRFLSDGTADPEAAKRAREAAEQAAASRAQQEAGRQEELARQAEAARRAEAERQAALEAERQAEAARMAQEKARLAEERRKLNEEKARLAAAEAARAKAAQEAAQARAAAEQMAREQENPAGTQPGNDGSSAAVVVVDPGGTGATVTTLPMSDASDGQQEEPVATNDEGRSEPPEVAVEPPVPNEQDAARRAEEERLAADARRLAEAQASLAAREAELAAQEAAEQARLEAAQHAAEQGKDEAAGLAAAKAAEEAARKAEASEAEARARHAEEAARKAEAERLEQARRQARAERLELPATGGRDTPGGDPAGAGVTARPKDDLNIVSTWGWGLMGGGILLFGAGGYATFLANDNADSANALDPMLPDYDSRFDSHYGKAQTWQTLSIVSYAVGTISLLVGLDFVLNWPVPVRSSARRTAWSLRPVPLADGAMMMMEMNIP